jgi:hypothetical protein
MLLYLYRNTVTVKIGGTKMKNLKGLYAEWRKLMEELMEDYPKTSVDCGEASVREDFSGYAELGRVISFEEMWELEKEYKKEN